MFASSSLVTYFDSADGQDNGHNKEEDPSNQSSCDSSPLDVFRQSVGELFTDGPRSCTVTKHSKQVSLGSTHVLHHIRCFLDINVFCEALPLFFFARVFFLFYCVIK